MDGFLGMRIAITSTRLGASIEYDKESIDYDRAFTSTDSSVYIISECIIIRFIHSNLLH